MSGKDDTDDVRRYQAPYSARRPIPTISRYREAKAARQQEALKGQDAGGDDPPPYPAWGQGKPERRPSTSGTGPQSTSEKPSGLTDDNEMLKDTSQVGPETTDPRLRRKELKNRKRERAEREVTDPVTHLPVIIHDFTDDALEELDFNYPPFGSTPETSTGLGAKQKSEEQLMSEKTTLQRDHALLINRFPPPDFEVLGQNMAAISRRGVTIGLSGTAIIVVATLAVERLMRPDEALKPQQGAAGRSWITLMALSGAAIAILIAGVREYTSRKVKSIFQDEIWDAQRRQTEARANEDVTESTAWLNSVLGSVWPLINPDLFASLCDTLEDVMQASLPRLVRMVSVEDIGQGSEALRILGIRWLPTGAAAQSVTRDGNLTAEEHCKNDVDGDGTDQDDSSERDSKQQSGGHAILEGMEGEEGDFINLEVAFAYRTRSSSKSLKSRTKDMHLYLAFYLPGNLRIPVWVDLQGIPKVDLSCMPLSQRGLNIMDVPLISNFVQSAVDAAVAEYVAPKSLTINLKDMLAGDDFKKDTNSAGILMIHIKRGYEFKMGDVGIPFFKEGSSDPYVSVGWAKFGKVLWSTRVLTSEMEPYWDETYFLLVTPEELNIEERLRVQLWDSDRFTADDDLGRIEVPLKELMKDDRSRGRMWSRVDGFRALKAGDNMPGKLEWSVGYFAKTKMQQCQFDQQTHDPEIRTMEQLKEVVDKSKLEQLKAQELKSEQDAMMISAPPPDGFPSGLLSLQIHNITGLELDKLSKRQGDDDDDEASDEQETGESLPSSYCTVIVNHSKTFKTRTKPQNAKPFFNAGCERFVRDWRECEVFVSVRDARLHEDNPLLGIVHLPLGDVFKERSQVMGFWPLTGGIGHGRIRLSLVWRSVQLQAPRNMLGWSYGTVDVQPLAISRDCPENLKTCKLKLKTNISMGKLYPQGGGEARWRAKKEQNLSLAVKKRYSSCMSIAFKDKGFFGDKVAAFCVLWLKDIPDEEEEDLELTIWKGDFERATACCLEECGEKVGSLKLKVTFWAGMGSAHSRWASRNQNVRDVVEVIDTARDNLDTDKMQHEAGIVDEEASSDSDSSDSSMSKDLPDGSVDDKQGPLDQIRDYRRRDKALHRQHRGIMQWKVPRTARWMKHKFERVGDGVTGLFDRHSKQAGIETEV
ncbi:c2 domain-containing protein [Hirsutella rhossiliensis]|uniref:C2 domain-containing protein n=1 Tax=Hirsutella rhossiliensis TaxID=111463 RepID=A0A9P8MPK7_9HYPO|nr:c2 domain-containing protein [Hirsutella rhossiliensis]KAH0957851.1 c2 domain-containing protein [Hirsutella rhossiliensis]